MMLPDLSAMKKIRGRLIRFKSPFSLKKLAKLAPNAYALGVKAGKKTAENNPRD